MSNADDLLNEFTGSDRSQQSDFSNRYEVLETLGQGGMGIVLKARNRALKKLVAIKVLHAAMIADATNGKRFEIEAQAGSKLSHPNLVSVFDYGFIKADTPYLVMEYIEGISLDKLLDEQNGSLPIPQLLDIFKQINKGLSYIHNNGIIHRDLKNSNIMIQTIDGEQYAKLLDFGIAKILADEELAAQHLTKTGSVFGSPPYMSPEQCMGKKTDARSDIYSIGCCMYECIAGTPPLLGDNTLQTIFKHANERPEQLPRGSSEIESKVADVIHKCLELAPEDRFQTAGELLAALNAVTQSVPQPQIHSLQSAEKADLDALRNRVIEQKVTREVPYPGLKEFGSLANSTLPIIHDTARDATAKPSGGEQLTTGRFKTSADEVKMPTKSPGAKTLLVVGALVVVLPLGGYFGFKSFQQSSKQTEVDKALAEADKTFLLGPSHFKQAKSSFKKALRLASDNDEIAGQVNSRQGRMLLQEDKLNGAFDQFTEARRRLSKTKDQHQEHYLDAVVGLGQIKLKQKSYSQAEDQFIEARKLAQEWSRDPVETGNIFALSALNARYNNREQAMFFYDQALDEYQKAKTRPSERIANAYIESAQVRKKMGINTDAKARLKKAEAECDKIADQSLKSETQRRISELIATIPLTDATVTRNPNETDDVQNTTSQMAVTQSQTIVAPQPSPATTNLPIVDNTEEQKQMALIEQRKREIRAIQEATAQSQRLSDLSNANFKNVTQQLKGMNRVQSHQAGQSFQPAYSQPFDGQ